MRQGSISDEIKKLSLSYANGDQTVGKDLLAALKAYQVREAQKDLSEAEPSWSWSGVKKGVFSFLVFCGVINATAEAFDGVSAILFALHVPSPVILASCMILGLFSISLYFAFELTQLSGAMGIGFIERYSEANRLSEIQAETQRIKAGLKREMSLALQQKNLQAFRDARAQLHEVLDALQPIKSKVVEIKSEKTSKPRAILKYSVAALAGFLSGAIAFFNGESLLHVLSALTGMVIGPQLMWLPMILGTACFMVVTSVSLVNEGRSMMRLIDKLLGKPSKVIHKLKPDAFELEQDELSYHDAAVRVLTQDQTVLQELEFPGLAEPAFENNQGVSPRFNS